MSQPIIIDFRLFFGIGVPNLFWLSQIKIISLLPGSGANVFLVRSK